MKHLLLLLTLISSVSFRASTARAITAEELAGFLGISSWRTTVALPRGSFSVALFEINDGAVGKSILELSPEEVAKKPEAGLSVVLGPRDGKYRVQIRLPDGSSSGSPTDIPLFDSSLSSAIPERVEVGDYVFFGKRKKAAPGGSNDLGSYERGFLLRVEKTPALSAVEEEKALRCLANAKMIALACKLYSMDHGDALPPDLDALFPDYLADRAVLFSPLGPNPNPVGYELVANEKADPPSKVLVRGLFTTSDGRRSVIYTNHRGAWE